MKKFKIAAGKEIISYRVEEGANDGLSLFREKKTWKVWRGTELVYVAKVKNERMLMDQVERDVLAQTGKTVNLSTAKLI